MARKTLMERAFELASESGCRDIDEIRRKLTAENFANVDAHLSGVTVRKQLRSIIRERSRLRPESVATKLSMR
jgi:hypothetical protein